MLIISDTIRITRKAVAEALLRKDPEPVAEMALAAQRAGADVIDINTGPLARDPNGMAFLVRAVEKAVPLRVSLDTVNHEALQAGLAASRNGRPIINGVSLEPEKLRLIAPLALRHDADLVAYLLTPKSQVPPDAEGRLAISSEIFTKLTGMGIAPERIMFDPICPPLVWQDGLSQAREVLSTIRLLPEVLGFHARTLVGLSNLTTGPGPRPKKILLQKTYLAMLAAQGLSAVLLDTDLAEVVETAKAASLIRSGEIFCWESLEG
ncbi:MAG: dihydropteroate synthase [Deltaproteobacteria bacterium]|nr:dihydropteroate synthase [Deltaproteobacteria bacterium]